MEAKKSHKDDNSSVSSDSKIHNQPYCKDWVAKTCPTNITLAQGDYPVDYPVDNTY